MLHNHGRIAARRVFAEIESGGLTMNLKSSNGAVTVLVVEDEPLILDMISQELAEQGFAVLEAETGEAALSIIESGQTVDVLFTDMRLPGELDGWQLAATAREAKPELPVIYATGYTVVVRRRCRAAFS